MDSVKIRKGEDLTFLTFCHTEFTKNVGDVRWFVVAPYAFIATVVHFPNQKENQGQLYLFLET